MEEAERIRKQKRLEEKIQEEKRKEKELLRLEAKRRLEAEKAKIRMMMV